MFHMIVMRKGGPMSTRICHRYWSILLLIAAISRSSTTSSTSLEVSSSSVSVSPFYIIVDGGSTGSRLHIFEFLYNATSNQTECIRRGSKRVNIPLSSFRIPHGNGNGNGNSTHPSHHSHGSCMEHIENSTENVTATALAQHMIPLFEYAAQAIPSSSYHHTQVKIQATAGMRLLSHVEQDKIYDTLYNGLISHPSFVFSQMKRSDIATLSGKLEGFYGVVAANYLQGRVDTYLRLKTTLSTEALTGEVDECTRAILPRTRITSDVHSAMALGENRNTTEEIQIQDTCRPLGALDMGGSSTQIVYFTTHSKKIAQEQDQKLSQEEVEYEPHSTVTGPLDTVLVNQDTFDTIESTGFQLPTQIHEKDFFSISHLSYGVDQFRERLWDMWIHDHSLNVQVPRVDAELINNESHSHYSTNDDHYMACCFPPNTIPNPCHFRGYIRFWKGYTFYGTGNATLCSMEINRLIPHYDHRQDETSSYAVQSSEIPVDGSSISKEKNSNRRIVGGVEHPTIQGKFFAMSLYFFTLDCLRELSAHEELNLSWPSPSIEALTNALDGFCSRSWYGDLELIQHTAHEFTRAEVLPDRCFESVYMVTLLRDGYGFHPSSKDITFTYLVQGSEVEWSLGMALSLFAEQTNTSMFDTMSLHRSNGDLFSLPQKWNTSVRDDNSKEEQDRPSLFSRFLSEVISSVPQWVAAISYQEIVSGREHLLVLL